MERMVTVIGNGPLSLGVAAQTSHAGFETVYVDLTRNDSTDIDDYLLKVEGAEKYNTVLKKVTNKYFTVKESNIIIVAATASYHKTILENIIPLLKNGQTIVFFPACFGAINFLKQINNMNLDLTICEAVSFFYVCEQRSSDTIYIQIVKNSIKMAVSPKEKVEDAFSLLGNCFKGLSHASNFLETSLDNMNMVLHPLPILLNLSAVEGDPKEFYHYTQGVSFSVGRLMQKMDDERMSIGKALGIKLTSAFEQLKEYYGERGLNSMTEYISSQEGPYTDVKGFGINSRYIVEDVPYLLVVASSIAKCCSVETPVIDLTIKLASLIMETEYISIGYNCDDLSDIV